MTVEARNGPPRNVRIVIAQWRGGGPTDGQEGTRIQTGQTVASVVEGSHTRQSIHLPTAHTHRTHGNGRVRATRRGAEPGREHERTDRPIEQVEGQRGTTLPCLRKREQSRYVAPDDVRGCWMTWWL